MRLWLFKPAPRGWVAVLFVALIVAVVLTAEAIVSLQRRDDKVACKAADQVRVALATRVAQDTVSVLETADRYRQTQSFVFTRLKSEIDHIVHSPKETAEQRRRNVLLDRAFSTIASVNVRTIAADRLIIAREQKPIARDCTLSP